MKVIQMGIGMGLVMLLGAARARSQEPATPTASTSADTVEPQATVLRLVKFTGVLKDPSGKPLRGTLSVSFALYESQDDAAPLWQETQELQVDEQGRYSVLLGATQSGGLPLEAFAGEQARWLGVQVMGQAEGPRVLLVSVPYALRAEEAEQLGGKPASDYVLATDLLDTLGRELQTGAQPSASGITPAKGPTGQRSGSAVKPSSTNQCLVKSGTKWALTGCNALTDTGSGWPSSWVTNTTTNAVTARPLAGQNAVVFTIAPNVASPSADLFRIYKDSNLTSKAFSINAQGYLTFRGNNVTFGSTNQPTQSYLRLYGSTANSKLAPPYLALLRTDATVKTFLAASTRTNGAICVSATAPSGDCPASGTIIKTTAFVLPRGPSWTSGTGAPTVVCTTGSLYSRIDGGAGSTLYVCEAGGWKAK